MEKIKYINIIHALLSDILILKQVISIFYFTVYTRIYTIYITVNTIYLSIKNNKNILENMQIVNLVFYVCLRQRQQICIAFF